MLSAFEIDRSRLAKRDRRAAAAHNSNIISSFPLVLTPYYYTHCTIVLEVENIFRSCTHSC